MRARHLLLPLVLLALVAFAPSRAEARGIVLITRGDSVKQIGEVAADQRALVHEMTGHDDLKVGYVFRYFGIFWIDFWTWDGSYCLYQDKTVWRLEPKEAAALMGVPDKKLGKPFLYSFPPGLIVVALFGALIGYGAIASAIDERRKKAQQPPTQQAGVG